MAPEGAALSDREVRRRRSLDGGEERGGAGDGGRGQVSPRQQAARCARPAPPAEPPACPSCPGARAAEKCGGQSEPAQSKRVPATTPTVGRHPRRARLAWLVLPTVRARLIRCLLPAAQIGVEMDTFVTAKPRARQFFEMREIGGIMVQLWQNYFEECGLLIVSGTAASSFSS